jgi:F0F1-type ATP synthase assembly protein I
MVMAQVLKIIVAILLIIVAWKLLKGILSIAFTLAALGLLVWGGMKLLEDKR